MIKIDTNPTNKLIDKRVQEAGEIVMLHNLRNEAHVREYELQYGSYGYTVIYIHYYTHDNVYSMGLIKNWSMSEID